MDLGAMVCLPGQPRCPSCPVKKFCAAKGPGDPARTGKKVKVRKENWAVALIEHRGQYLLVQKEGKGLLAGLWQFPYIVVGNGLIKSRDERALLKSAIEELSGLEIEVGKSVPAQDHFFTHIHAVMKPYLCSLPHENLLPSLKTGRWIKPGNFARYPISTAMKKISQRIGDF